MISVSDGWASTFSWLEGQLMFIFEVFFEGFGGCTAGATEVTGERFIMGRDGGSFKEMIELSQGEL